MRAYRPDPLLRKKNVIQNVTAKVAIRLSLETAAAQPEIKYLTEGRTTFRPRYLRACFTSNRGFRS